MNNQYLIQALGIENEPQEARMKILAKVDKRLQEVILETLVEKLSESDARELREALALEGNLEEKVARITARIPGIADKLEQAITKEISRIRTALTE